MKFAEIIKLSGLDPKDFPSTLKKIGHFVSDQFFSK